MQFADDQAASRLVFDDGRVLTKCDQCRQIYAERTPPGSPPCESCRVELKEENEDAARIFQVSRNQVIAVGEQVVDIDIKAVKIVMDLYGVKDQRTCLQRVRALWHEIEGKRRASET